MNNNSILDLRHITTGLLLFIIATAIQSCSATRASSGAVPTGIVNNKTVSNVPVDKTTMVKVPARNIDTKQVKADDVVDFAETLIGTRYKYGSAIKEQGFDCSGLITYVFSKFNIVVPRSSVNFTNAGKQVSLASSKRGDLILFTGSDTTGWNVGHMGIITNNDQGNIKFIHSSSGKNVGVIISPMSSYYYIRFVKVIRVFM